MKNIYEDERGFTLIEVLVTLLIFSVLLVIGLNWINSMANQQIAVGQRAVQDSERVQLTTTISQRLALTTSTQLGLPMPGETTGLDPLTLASDQLVFLGSDNRCHRIYYRERTNEIRLQTGEVGDGCDEIRPVRGPNERDEEGYWITANFGDADYDPGLDDADSSYQLVGNVNSTPPANAPAGSPDPLRLFRYLDATSDELPAQFRADREIAEDSEEFYADYDPANGEGNVYAIDWTAYLNAPGSHAFTKPLTAGGSVAIEQ